MSNNSSTLCDAYRNRAGSSAMARAGLQRLSSKQIEIMLLIRAGNGRDEGQHFHPIDLDQLIERLTYKPTKDSIHFSVRALIGRGLIAKGERLHRRGRARCTLIPTEYGWTYGTFSGPIAVVENSVIPRGVVEAALDELQTILD